MKRFLCCLVVLAAVAVAPAFADININGTFQPGPGDAFSTIFASNTFAQTSLTTYWTVTVGSVDWIGSYWVPPTQTGGYSVDLDGNAPGGIAQTVGLSAGSYILNFFLSGNPDGLPTTKTVDVTAGSSSQTFTYALTGSNTESNMLWAPESLTFTASGPTTIAFTSLDSASPWGPALAGVSLTQVPEAGFYSYSAAFALGLIGFLMLIRRKRQA